VGPCHHGLVCPHIVGGDGLHVLNAAVNLLNKQSQTADKGLTTPHCKKQACYRMSRKASAWTDS
jgi:hypothetical protein